jgi:hypothetical protein
MSHVPRLKLASVPKLGQLKALLDAARPINAPTRIRASFSDCQQGQAHVSAYGV